MRDHDTKTVAPIDSIDTSRRTLLKLTGAGVATLGMASLAATPALAQGTGDWDKVFPKSTRVDHRKVVFYNRLGIRLVADLYLPRDAGSAKRSALVVGHPFGGVKEQTAGLYAQTMAERGFVTLAHDASYQGESGGSPHFLSSPEANVEDYSAAIDYLGTLPQVDRNRIGVIGICGGGGWALIAAKIDPRIRAIATVSLYDIGQSRRQGLSAEPDRAAIARALREAADQRWADVDRGTVATRADIPETLSADADPVMREFFDYYRTPRGQHPRAKNLMTVNSLGAIFHSEAISSVEGISPRPALFVMGETAHSRIFSEQAFAKAAEPKELYIVPGAGHVDLYDKINLIPFEKLESFFVGNLA
ncbi:alpha/beta hydrolase [Sphingomonas ursincola]|uniref:alpha/beta hydrolase n=1 Tax=Sphingomonas ursincola TaxID=56361 RepID=UPI002353D519|nr:alpha/beta hydrolase [Sphingomonas ursincola]MBY0621627.1 alpha/beta hydrolase [Sphingomonas ursincola]